MSQQSDMAEEVYQRLSGGGTVSSACLIRELRARWGNDHGVSSVHSFVREVATCLLHFEDVDIGHVEDGKFVAWTLDPWDADEKFDSALMAMDHFLENETRYVFQRK
jgi:hypothetical protein